MWKMRQVCHSKCMTFSVSVLSHASVIPNFKYGKFLHARNWSKQVPWRLHAKWLSYSHLFLHTNLMWMHYTLYWWFSSNQCIQDHHFFLNVQKLQERCEVKVRVVHPRSRCITKRWDVSTQNCLVEQSRLLQIVTEQTGQTLLPFLGGGELSWIWKI